MESSCLQYMSKTIIRHREWESDDSSEEGTFMKSKGIQ